VILVTAYAEPNAAMDAMSRGAADYLTKPVDISALIATVERALDRKKLSRDHRALSREVPGKRTMIGTSPAMIELYKQTAQAAPTHATIYIHGESGAGKELVARTIHERSRRAHGPFVAVNCAALTESLLESELFGHERGSFTGAQATRRGLFEEATGGTLFLDEIGDISPKVQAQLLRVLQEGEVRRVGGNQAIAVDVRVITASHRDLAEEMTAGRLRSDLYYRLSVVMLQVPPLRERGDDLVALTRHFAARHSLELGRPNPEISDAAMAVIRGHTWPGNVRELENAMARAVAMCRSDVILPSDLPPTVRPAPATAELAVGEVSIDGDWPTLEVLQQRYVEKVLAHTQQNKTAAAQLLGIDRRTLQRNSRD
jgi:DNA-binding NtrC family response regulator